MGDSKGRRSGGCAIFGQPCLVAGQGFHHQSGRICGLFTSGGFILSVYFPTKQPKQKTEQYKFMFSTFVDDLISVVGDSISGREVSWIVCGADLNAHFAGCGLPPRRKDDFAAGEVRRFMKEFSLVSLASEMSPDRFTYMNSRGGASCVDTFLISVGLYDSGCVTLYEVLDFVEHGSDHSPVYLRLRIHPKWIKRSKPVRKRILKTRGVEYLRKKLNGRSQARKEIVLKIQSSFSGIGWSKAESRTDMNRL